MILRGLEGGQIVSSKRGLFGGLTHRVRGSRPHFTSFFSFALFPSDDDDDNEYVVPVRDRMLMQLIIYSEQQLRLIVCYKSTLKMIFIFKVCTKASFSQKQEGVTRGKKLQN